VAALPVEPVVVLVAVPFKNNCQQVLEKLKQFKSSSDKKYFSTFYQSYSYTFVIKILFVKFGKGHHLPNKALK
jgi:hypothetical protein